MANQNPASPNPDQPNPANPGGNPPPPAPPRKRRRGRWWKVLLILLLLLVLLIVFAPTIASTGPVRGLVVSQIGNYINGKAEIADWSIGWTKGIDVHGVRVFDEQNALILEVPRVQTQLSLLDAMRGNFHLGQTIVDVNFTRLVIDQQGNSNYQKLLKTSPSAPSAGTQPSQPAAPSQLPNVTGDITVNYRGTVEGEGVGPQAIYIDASTLTAKITSINDPINETLKMVYRIGSGAAGTIGLAGTAKIAENNQLLPPQKMSASQKLDLADVNLGAAVPFLKMAHMDAQAAGIANGSLQLDAAGMDKLTADGQIKVAAMQFGGPILKGDVFHTSVLNLPIRVSRQVTGDTTVLKIDRLGAEFDQGSIIVTGQVPQEALNNLAQRKAPGYEGQVQLDIALSKLPDLAKTMPNTFRLLPGVELTGGSFTQTTTIALTKESVTVKSSYSLKDLTARKNAQVVGPLKPVEGTVEATAIPTNRALPDLKNLLVKLQSPFATINGGGESLADVKITGNYDLKRLREDLGQIFDLELLRDGQGEFTLATKGDPTDYTQPLAVRVNLKSTNLSVQFPQSTTQPAELAAAAPTTAPAPIVLSQPWLLVDCSSNVMRDPSGMIQAVKDLKLIFQSGNPQTPTVDAQIHGDADFASQTTKDASGNPTSKLALTRAAFAADKLIVDLAKVQSEFAPFLARLRQMQIDLASGNLTATAAGTFDGATIKLDQPLAMVISKLTVRKTGPAAPASLLADETVNVNVAGTFDVGSQTKGATLSDLSVTTSSNLVSLQKSPQRDLIVHMAANGAFSGNGAVALAANLPRVNDVLQAFMGKPLVEALRSGQLNGMIQFVRAERPQTEIEGKFDITSLTVADKLSNEKVTITVSGTAPDEMASIQGKADVASSFATISVPDVLVMLKTGAGRDAKPTGLWDIVRRAVIKVDKADLAKLYALSSRAQASPAPVPPVPSPAEIPIARSPPSRPLM